MEFTEVVRSRRMIRSYQPDRPVERAVIEQLLALAIRAPSAGFSQGWHFVVLSDAADRARYWELTTDPDEAPDAWLANMRTAPVLILALSDKRVYLDRYAAPDKGLTERDEADWPVPYWDIDTGMASLLILLGATDAGLASCFFGVPVEDLAAVKDAFGAHDDQHVVGVISLGYAAPDRKSPSLKRGRRGLDTVVSWGRIEPTG